MTPEEFWALLPPDFDVDAAVGRLLAAMARIAVIEHPMTFRVAWNAVGFSYVFLTQGIRIDR